MKKAGEILSAFFDRDSLEKARGYHNLFSSWASITRGVRDGEQIAAHSRIIELDKTILIVEADHPGWIQILQTRQRTLLDILNRRFPDLEIRGISFRLSRGEPPAASEHGPAAVDDSPGEAAEEERGETEGHIEIDAIADEDFRETLRHFKESIEKGGMGR